jgi:hypothetical protein
MREVSHPGGRRPLVAGDLASHHAAMEKRTVVAIIGSQGFADAPLVAEVVRGLVAEFGSSLEIVSGGAPGADTLGIAAARGAGATNREILPDHATWGPEAHSRRNLALAEAADVVVAFFGPGPRSPGTSETLGFARARGIPARVHHDGRWADE